MVLEVKNIVYYYKTNKSKNVLNGISYKYEEGKVYAILGASGSGKTTFLSLLAGLDVPVLGTILYEEEDILKGGLNHHRKEHVSLVFQNYNLIDYLTPKENVMLGGNGNPEELLTAVGIQKEDWDRKVLQLSGGQQQRVAIARALASPAKVLLADTFEIGYIENGKPLKLDAVEAEQYEVWLEGGQKEYFPYFKNISSDRIILNYHIVKEIMEK